MENMDGFSYTNIFETKGIEYLIIISFLVLIVPFWVAINRKAKISKQIKQTLGVLSAGMLKIPQGLYYSKNHTWAHLGKSGSARVGLDDFLMHLTGEVRFSNLKNRGEVVRKGDLLTEIDQNGKILKIFSPLSGEILNTNTVLSEHPGLLNDDPYGQGWIFEIKPSKWIAETSSCYLAEEAISWSKKELERFKDFMSIALNKYAPETSMVVLQDGGELSDKPLAELPDEVWQDFQKTFLN